MPTCIPNLNLITASNQNPNSKPNLGKSTRVKTKSVQYRGVWLKRARDNKGKKKEENERFATEIQYHTKGPRLKLWLGKYDTTTEASIAYDLAAAVIEGNAPKCFIGENREIQAPVSSARLESIQREVEKLIEGKFKGNSSNEAYIDSSPSQ